MSSQVIQRMLGRATESCGAEAPRSRTRSGSIRRMKTQHPRAAPSRALGNNLRRFDVVELLELGLQILVPFRLDAALVGTPAGRRSVAEAAVKAVRDLQAFHDLPEGRKAHGV